MEKDGVHGIRTRDGIMGGYIIFLRRTLTVEKKSISKICWLLDSNLVSLVSEATVPKPLLLLKYILLGIWTQDLLFHIASQFTTGLSK